MLICNCTLAGTTACFSCINYLQEYGARTTPSMNLPQTTIPTTVTYNYTFNPDTEIITKYKKSIQHIIDIRKQDLKEYLDENNYRGAHETNIEIEAYESCLKIIEEVKNE